MRTRYYVFSLLFIIVISATPACNTSRPGGKNKQTAAQFMNTNRIDGEAGALIEAYMDRQAEAIRTALEDTQVERIGEGILLTFDSGLLFDVGSYQLRAGIRDNLIKLGDILNQYRDTGIIIEGHTDDRGTEEYNQILSENRAKSVYNQLVRQGIAANRLSVLGFGESAPIADNNTAEGRQQNRRVAIGIFANKKLKKAAKQGNLSL
ncbi:MAG TPA: OmpA family protein [Saprospiraceae bacterium]|nr:OmpA family protein [Saprospiraceae bacterium]HMP26145.1 OmpA family protein [Saprospiraceae bacterium]